MTDQEIIDNYELYALGLLDNKQRREFEEHLEKHPHLRAGAAAMLGAVAALGAAAPPVDPPARLRARLMASIEAPRTPERVAAPERSRFTWWQWAPALVAAGLAVMLVRSGMEQQSLEKQLAAARTEITSREAALGASQQELVQLRRAMALLQGPQTRLAKFGQGPTGNAFVNPQGGVVLLAGNLPRLDAGRIFQMWLVPKKGAPISAGLFTADSAGRAVYVREGAVDLSAIAAVAVSVEPEAGSTAPTTTPIVIAPIAAD